MQISSRFTIAVHMLACMEAFRDEYKVTSDFLASSIHVNPVIIRNILLQLKEIGLIEVKRGPGGATVAKPPDWLPPRQKNQCFPKRKFRCMPL